MQSQFLRYLFGLLVLLPLVWRAGLAAYRPKRIGGQFTRGAVHTLGWCCGSARCRASRWPT
jgi:hypothetical protein